MKTAVVGAGISGLTAAGRNHTVDTGFVVYNTETYPSFVRLIDGLGIESQPTQMSFNVRCDASGLEYCGTPLNTIFAQRRTLLNASFLAMLLEILQFNRSAGRAARGGRDLGTLGEFLSRTTSNERFRTHYLAPLVAAIWSMDPADVEDFPTAFFLRFMARHRLFQVRDQLEWRVIRGGSRTYVARLVGLLRDGVRTESTVDSVRRDDDGVEVRLEREASALRSRGDSRRRTSWRGGRRYAALDSRRASCECGSSTFATARRVFVNERSALSRSCWPAPERPWPVPCRRSESDGWKP